MKTKNILLLQESSTVVTLQQRCDGLMSEKEELLVECVAQQGRIKVLEEERNGLLEESSNFRFQLQQASEDHKIMAEQLKVYESDFEKERAQREKLLAEYDTLKSEKNSLQQEKNASSDEEKLQAKLKLLEEEMRGLEKERNGYIEEIKDFRSQLQKAAEDHTSQVEIAAQQLMVYKSDFEKERAQREKLLAENDMLKNSLQQEKDSIVARLQQCSDEKEKLQVQLQLLEEKRRGLEQERNGLLTESKDLHSQLQQASEDHKIMAVQLKVYESDFEKERAQREKLFAGNNTLQTEKDTLVARLQQYEVVAGCGPSAVRSLSLDVNGQHPAHPQSTSRSRSDDPQRPPPWCATTPPHPAHQSMATPMSPPYPLTTPYSAPGLTTPRATPPPHNSPLQVAPSLQVTPLPRQGMCAEMCPICGRSGFRTITDLEHHSGNCNDFKN
ncbi:hypothetical protein EMCRGX_G018346 [Ephydatia muelleri]